MLILRWTPRPTAFALQFASFALRIGLAYAIFLAALLVLARLSAGIRVR